jgi:hypothetical protein
MGLVISRYFLSICHEFQRCLPDLYRGTRRSPHVSSLLRRHFKAAEDPHINRSFTHTQDLPDTWARQQQNNTTANDSGGTHWRVELEMCLNCLQRYKMLKILKCLCLYDISDKRTRLYHIVSKIRKTYIMNPKWRRRKQQGPNARFCPIFGWSASGNR